MLSEDRASGLYSKTLELLGYLAEEPSAGSDSLMMHVPIKHSLTHMWCHTCGTCSTNVMSNRSCTALAVMLVYFWVDQSGSI